MTDAADAAFAWHEECPRCPLCDGHRHAGTCRTCYAAGADAERQRIRQALARRLHEVVHESAYTDLLDGDGDAS